VLKLHTRISHLLKSIYVPWAKIETVIENQVRIVSSAILVRIVSSAILVRIVSSAILVRIVSSDILVRIV